MDNCLFCKIIKGEIPNQTIYEDEDWLAFLDINPVNLGHTLLIPKNHCRNLLDLPNELLTKLGSVLQKLAQAVKTGSQADGLNVIWNNEIAAGQLIGHAHLHLIPRFNDDGLENWPTKKNLTPTDFTQTRKDIIDQLI